MMPQRCGQGIRVNAVNMGWCYTENEDALQKAQSGDPNWIDKAAAPPALVCVQRVI